MLQQHTQKSYPKKNLTSAHFMCNNRVQSGEKSKQRTVCNRKAEIDVKLQRYNPRHNNGWKGKEGRRKMKEWKMTREMRGSFRQHESESD